MDSPNQVLDAIEIRGPEAVWVLTAHLYALLMPLTLCVAVYYNWDYLVASTYSPVLFYIAAGLLCAGSAFEVAQNAFDGWYLTSDSPSANGTGFADFLFYWLITAGQGLCALAIAGDIWWVGFITIAAVLLFPFCYILRMAYIAPMAAVSALTVCLAFVVFGDPVIFLQLLLGGVTMFFFGALLETGAQVIHGFTTVSASSGTWFFIHALFSGASGSSHSWALVAGVTGATIVAGLLLWPVLTRLPASERVNRAGSGNAVAH